MPLLAPLSAVVLEPIVRTALLEDLGRAGDLTSDAIIPQDRTAEFVIVARERGVIAGIDAAALAFRLMAPQCRLTIEKPDGSAVRRGDIVATVTGAARGLLMAERTALNFLGHLSGVATATATFVDAVRHHRAQIVCTRKTTPGLRALEKYAVRAGGGANHRFGLDDAMLIKDNHIAIAGSVRAAVEMARAHAGHLVKIEVEVDRLDQLEEAMRSGVDAVLLDNMSPEQLVEAVRLVDGHALTEASGGVTRQTVTSIAATGVDLVSVGWITHSAPVLDVGLDANLIVSP